jgi:transposase
MASVSSSSSEPRRDPRVNICESTVANWKEHHERTGLTAEAFKSSGLSPLCALEDKQLVKLEEVRNSYILVG